MTDFARNPDRADGYMRRARALVEAHIANYGMVPHPDKIKEAIAAEFDLVLANIRADRASILTAPSGRYRPPTPSSPETMKIAEDWYTYGMQLGMDSQREAQRKSAPSHDDLCILSGIFNDRDIPIPHGTSFRINEWLKAQIAEQTNLPTDNSLTKPDDIGSPPS